MTDEFKRVEAEIKAYNNSWEPIPKGQSHCVGCKNKGTYMLWQITERAKSQVLFCGCYIGQKLKNGETSPQQTMMF